MCRMFGFRSAVSTSAHQSLLLAENALADQSRLHQDGWGIGWFLDDDAYVIKSANAAHACRRFERISERLRSHTFLVHVRRATVGQVDHLNAHPFRHGRWLFCHNGTIPTFDKLKPWLMDQVAPHFRGLILGDTDTEHLLYYLLSGIEDAGLSANGRHPSDAGQVMAVVRERLFALDRAAVERGLERPLCNVLLTDGRFLLAHRAGMPLYLSTQKRFCPDFETCPEPSKVCMKPERTPDHYVNHLLVASEPIGGQDNIWEDVVDGASVLVDEKMNFFLAPAPSDWTAPVLPERFRIIAKSCSGNDSA